MARFHLYQRVLDELATLNRSLHQPFLFNHFQRRQGRGGGDGVAAIGAAVGTRSPGHQLLAGNDAADRQAAADALGEADNVGLDVLVLHRPPVAGAARAALDFVDHEQDAVAVAHFAQAGEEAGRGHDVAALALDRFDEDTGNIGRRQHGAEHLVFDIVHDDIAVGLVWWAGQDGTIGVGVGHVIDLDASQVVGPLDGLAGGEGQRAEGAAVERAHEADEARAAGGVHGQLDGRLDRFGAGVAEVDLRRPVHRRDGLELLGQGDGLRIEEVR